MSVGLAVVTYNRPEYCFKTLRAVARHLSDVVDDLVVVNDGSDPKHAGAYKRAYRTVESMGATILSLSENRGVAAAKNAGLRYLLNGSSDWLFVLEDDVIVRSPRAITGYIESCESSMLHSLSFAHAGTANDNVEPYVNGLVSYYTNGCGAFAVYSCQCLEDVGLYDENMRDVWNDIELPLRLAHAGWTIHDHPFGDATGSEDWLASIPGCVTNSSVIKRPDWIPDNVRVGLQYWHDEKPETFAMLFGPGTKLEEFANNVLGEQIA